MVSILRSTVFLLSCIVFLTRSRLTCASRARISSYPIAVRNPYLSAWLPQNISQHAPTAKPQFWYGQDLTWPVLARVNGEAFTLFGAPKGVPGAVEARQLGISFTATHTRIHLLAGLATFELDFFSPVSPNNMVRQSLPYSYLTVTATSHANARVEIFSAYDESWTGARGFLEGRFQQSDNTLIYTLSNPFSIPFQEKDEMATWGAAVFAVTQLSETNVTFQSGALTANVRAFLEHGKLGNKKVPFAQGHLCAFAVDLGYVDTSGRSARFAVGYDRELAVNFRGQPYTSYSRSRFRTIVEAVSYFFKDYAAAFLEAQNLDLQVVNHGMAFSELYTDLLEASLRQIYGAMEVVIPHESLDTQETLVFLKEISSNGDVSTVDVIYPTSPALHLLSPEYIKLLLKPYLMYLQGGTWPYSYIPHDLGSYPNAVGHDDGKAENIYVEATGSFFILIQLYQKASGASSEWLTPYLEVLYAAADWLVANGLYPANQRSTVDQLAPTANQTGLAQSAAVGLKALGAALGVQNYTDAGTHFGSMIYPILGTDNEWYPSRFLYNYYNTSTWVTAFDLFTDNLLELDTFPVQASKMQAKWYANRFRHNGAIPYSHNANFVISEWLMWAAAVSDKVAPHFAIRERAIRMVHQFLTNLMNNVPFPTKFHIEGHDFGHYIANKARSTVGSMWAPMALSGNWSMRAPILFRPNNVDIL